MYRLLKVIFWLGVFATLFFTLEPHPPHVSLSDKSEHAIDFAILFFAAGLAYREARLLPLAFALSGFGALIEFIQPYFHRDKDWRDWLADTIGIAIAMVILWLVRRFLPRR